MNTEKINLFTIFDRDTRIHLRLPFSFYLLPVFCFGISQASTIYVTKALLAFIVLHLFTYPASNIYNSYMDKDTGSIGGIKNPPPATGKLYIASIIFDIIGLLLACLVSWKFALIVAIYIAFSKAYSWQGIHLKRYAIAAWLTVAILQGGYTFLMANTAASGIFTASWFNAPNTECMLIASVLIAGSYPLTQIYQHKEDKAAGIRTISSRLGIKGTFIFSGLSFFAGAVLMLHYFSSYYSILHFIIFLLFLAPVIVYFMRWFLIAIKNPGEANFERTMLMNKISSICMTLFFLGLLYLNSPSIEFIW